jgi:hypothetical protein
MSVYTHEESVQEVQLIRHVIIKRKAYTNLDVLNGLGHGDPLDAGLSPQLLHNSTLLLNAGHFACCCTSCPATAVAINL